MTIPRDQDSMFDQPVVFERDFAAIAATSTLPMVTVQRPYRIERIELMVDATYASDAANYYVLTLEHGSGPTTSGTWSTLTGADGTITGGTPVLMDLSADANLVVPAGDVISLLATKHASGANITPRVVIHGRYV